MHAGPSAPRLAAPAPSTHTVIDDSPLLQVNIILTSSRQYRRAQGCPGSLLDGVCIHYLARLIILQRTWLQNHNQTCSTGTAMPRRRLHCPCSGEAYSAAAVQIFPGGYYLCKPGQPRKDCLTLQPGRKLLQGWAPAGAPQTARGMQQSTGAPAAAYTYLVTPGITP